MPSLPHTTRMCAARLIAGLAHHYPFHKGRSRLIWLMDDLLPKGDYLLEARLSGGPARVKCSRRDLLALRLFTYGEDEPHVYRLLQTAVQAAGPGAVFVDVGANLATLSIRLSRYHGCRSICFEPQPRLAELLAQNAAANGVSELIEIHRAALADREGETSFFINPDHLGEASMRQLSKGEKITVPLRRLDALIPPEQWRKVAIMKVDVEGFEREVFLGASGLFAVHRPPIVFEVNLEALGERKMAPREVTEVLREAGYTEFHAVEEVLYPPANGVYGITNILATTRDHAALGKAYGVNADFQPTPRPFYGTQPIEI